ncbi:hypothetical protein PBI_SCTP2_107 [Salicola phage SCTP-2]|nr:hypothetical protein PBI_SCTP2_107 [Salicola phage SCTP-2]
MSDFKELDKNDFKKQFRLKHIMGDVQPEGMHRHQTFFQVSEEDIMRKNSSVMHNVFDNIKRVGSTSFTGSNIISLINQRVEKGAYTTGRTIHIYAKVCKMIENFYATDNECIVITVIMNDNDEFEIDEYIPSSITNAKDYIREKHNYNPKVFTAVFIKNVIDNTETISKTISEKYNCAVHISNNNNFMGYFYQISIDLNKLSEKNIEKILELYSNYKTQMKYKNETKRYLNKKRKVVQQNVKKPRSIKIFTDKISCIHKLKIADIIVRNLTVNVSQEGLKEW